MATSAHDEVVSSELFRKPTVLVVEDVALVRMLLADTLRTRGFEVIEAESGEEAVRVIEADFPVRVVLSDVYMPGAAMDGIALARWVRHHRPQLKVILGSGLPIDFNRLQSYIHVGPVLEKPYDLDHLERRLRSALL